MRIILDATGGDKAPGINLEGTLEALRAWPDVEIILLGPAESLEGVPIFPAKTFSAKAKKSRSYFSG